MIRKSYVLAAAAMAVAVGFSFGGAASVAAVVRPATKGTVTDIADPDAYTCPEPGFVGFENIPAGTTLAHGTIANVDFTTGGAFDWTVGDFGSGADNGAKFPAGPLTSEQTNFATTNVAGSGVIQGRIDLLDGDASTFSVLVKDSAKVTLEAHAAGGALLSTTGAHASPGGRHMIAMQVGDGSHDIAYAILKVPAGSPFTLDSICTDANGVPTGQVNLSTADGAPHSSIVVDGSGFGNNETVDVSINDCFNGSAPTDGTGAFSLKMTLCSTVAPGAAMITATGETSHIKGAANFLVHTDWPQLGNDQEKDPFERHETVLTPDTVAGLTGEWAASTAGRASAADVVDGLVYTTSANNQVFAINEQSGAVVWSVDTGKTLRAAPAVDNGMVFVAAGDEHLYALDADTGAHLWTFDANVALIRSPLVMNGVVYFGADNGDVFTLAEKTGKKIWIHDLESAVHSTLASDGTLVFAGTDSGTLYALNPQTGATKWHHTTGGRIRSSPAVVVGGNVFVGSDDGLVWAWKASTGKFQWTYDTHRPIGAPPAVAEGLVFIGDEFGNLLMLSQSDGTLVHSYPTGSSITSKAAVANDVVYVGSSSEDLYAISVDTGALLLPAPIHVGLFPTEITVANGGVYVGSEDHVLYKFAIK